MGWGGSVGNRVLSVIMVLAIVGALGTLVLNLAVPREESFSEFYLLGSGGEVKDYPSLLTLGEEGRVVVGIINREHEVATYRVEVGMDEGIISRVGPVTLEHDEKWEGAVAFTPDRMGEKQKVEFLLYKQGRSEVYRRLYLWLDVR